MTAEVKQLNWFAQRDLLSFETYSSVMHARRSIFVSADEERVRLMLVDTISQCGGSFSPAEARALAAELIAAADAANSKEAAA